MLQNLILTIVCHWDSIPRLVEEEEAWKRMTGLGYLLREESVNEIGTKSIWRRNVMKGMKKVKMYMQNLLPKYTSEDKTIVVSKVNRMTLSGDKAFQKHHTLLDKPLNWEYWEKVCKRDLAVFTACVCMCPQYCCREGIVCAQCLLCVIELL